MKDVFQKIYEENAWKSDESVSGLGSTLQATAAVREALPDLLKSFNIHSVLDIPCGDMNWIAETILDKVNYYGADIVPELITANKIKFGELSNVYLDVLDITANSLPKADLVLVRDLLGHFSNYDVKLALRNLRASGSTYLLATTFPGRENVTDIETGQWRPINLASLFGLPPPLLYISEDCIEGGGKFKDKQLGLWRIN